MYMMVENKGVADVRAFTKLGLSSARNQADKIGQFGSGAKHGVLTLMRFGLNPRIYCGKEKVEFYSQPNTMGDTEYNDMFVKVGNKAPVELSFCLEFGSIDWTDIGMGLREIVSNAIDNCENPANDLRIEVAENPRAKSEYTRVFIPLTPEVQSFLNGLSDKFLHFSSRDQNQTVLEKQCDGPARIYRKGVFVREIADGHQAALYDYNFGENLAIDESRNSNVWECMYEIGRAVSHDRETIRKVFERFVDKQITKEECVEDSLSKYQLHAQSWWLEVWGSVAGENGVIFPPHSTLTEFATKKGKTPYILPRGWYDEMVSAGISKGSDWLTEIENNGCQSLPATDNAKKMLNEVWGWVEDLELTNNKKQPKIKCFSRVLDTNTETLMGYVSKDGTIHINLDFEQNRQTYLEEVAHYITESRDGSREFQEFAFQIATRMANVIYS